MIASFDDGGSSEKSLAGYCKQFDNPRFRGGEIEFRAFELVYKTTVHCFGRSVLDRDLQSERVIVTRMSAFGDSERAKGSAGPCVFVVWNGGHYEPMFRSTVVSSKAQRRFLFNDPSPSLLYYMLCTARVHLCPYGRQLPFRPSMATQAAAYPKGPTKPAPAPASAPATASVSVPVSPAGSSASVAVASSTPNSAQSPLAASVPGPQNSEGWGSRKERQRRNGSSLKRQFAAYVIVKDDREVEAGQVLQWMHSRGVSKSAVCLL